MLTALTIMVFLILVVVALHYNDHHKCVIQLQNSLEKQLEQQKKLLEMIEHNTDMDNMKNRGRK